MNLITKSVALEEQQLFSKEAIQLSPNERLKLLLQAKRYPCVRKKTSAECQVKEMLDLYNLYCIILAKFFPSAMAEEQCMMLYFAKANKISRVGITDELAFFFEILENYEELEKRISAIQKLFDEYRSVFPDIYQKYNLEEIAESKISDIIEHSRDLWQNDSVWISKVLNRWELY